MSEFATALSDISQCWPAFVPPSRAPVSQGVAATLRVARPGGAAGYFSLEETPYMVRPMDLIASRAVRAICFVGPAQSGKTLALVDGAFTHAVVNDPGDMLIVQMTQDKAREFSKQRVSRAVRNSPALWALRGNSAQDDNLHDKTFANGMMLKIAWPTPSNLASTSYRYAISTDYDRVEDDIGGEGDMFSMLLARIRTFMSRGKVIVESSPGRPLKDPNWRPQTPHEAPPVGGVLGIYNRGDRERFYWKCPHCAGRFEASPGLGLFHLPPEEQLYEDIRGLDIDRFATQYARVICPLSGCVIGFEHRNAMNATGLWLPEGVTIDDHDRISGNPRTSTIASFWLGGVAASYSTWQDLIRRQMQGLLEYALSGKEEALQTSANTEQGVPYMPRHLAMSITGDATPLDRAEETLEQYRVPDEARYLVAFVDVQGGRNARFVVQVHAIGPHQEEWLVDRFAITKSRREGLGEEYAPLDPASHAEDWDLITERVVRATYRTSDPEHELRVLRVGIDSGGEDGVTDKAYAYYRRLRREGLAHRVRICKGDNKAKADWYIRESLVGAKSGQGDIPLQLLNTNKLKDVVDACLKRRRPGPGYYHFPKPRHPMRFPEGWVAESFYDELSAEVRNERGLWEQIKKRNESFDCCAGIKALNMMLGVDRRGFWDNPPGWAKPLAENSERVKVEERREEQRTAAVASRPAPVAVVQPRRMRGSNYLAG